MASRSRPEGKESSAAEDAKEGKFTVRVTEDVGVYRLATDCSKVGEDIAVGGLDLRSQVRGGVTAPAGA